MSPSESQSLALGRERRKPKLTARAQQQVDQQQERIERDQQAKEQAEEKARTTRQAELINDKGDDLMYATIKRYATPAVAGADNPDDLDDLDDFDGLDEQEQSDRAEAKYILQLLSHRGDGDWAPYYRAGHVQLQLLRDAQDNPGEKIIDHAMEQLGLMSAKGKGKATDVDMDAGEVPTDYTGITTGRSRPELPNRKDNASTTPRLKYPPPSPPTASKRQIVFDLDPSPIKKPRIDAQGAHKMNEQSGPQSVTFGSHGRDAAILGGNPIKKPTQLEPRKPTTSDQDQHQVSPRPPKPRDPRDNSNPTVLPNPRPPAPPTQNRPFRSYDDWGQFGDVSQPRPLKPAPTTTDHASLSSQLPPSRTMRTHLAEGREARPGTNLEAINAQRPALARNHTTTYAQVDQPQSNKPPPGNVRVDEPRRNPLQDKPKTSTKQRSSNAHATPPTQKSAPVQKSGPTQQRRKPASQHRQPDHRGQVIPDNEEDEEDEDDRRNAYAHFNNQRGPLACIIPKATVGSFETYEQVVVKRMILKAKPQIIAGGTFSWREGDRGKAIPDVDTIVADSFAIACRERGQRFNLLTEHITCVRSLVTTYRHDVKMIIAPLVERDLGFLDNERQFNCDMSEWLLPHAFHEDNPEGGRNDRLPYESKFIFKAIARTLFGPSKLGKKHQALFAPVPIRFLAFVCSICNHVIYCYRRGFFDYDEHLNESIQEHAFQKYLVDLDQMSTHRGAALRRICALMYDDACEGAGHQPAAQLDPPARNWGPDIAEEYVPRFAVLAPEHDDSNDEDYDYQQNASLSKSKRGKTIDPQRSSNDARRQIGRRNINEDDHNAGPSRPYGAETHDRQKSRPWLNDQEPESSNEEMDG